MLEPAGALGTTFCAAMALNLVTFVLAKIGR
jgi:hypothetical protein